MNHQGKGQKGKLQILIFFMKTGAQTVNFIKLKLQGAMELQQMIEHLKKKNKLPFKNCIFTNKPAHKGQFTLQKTIKEISSQCKYEKGAAVLLCYQSQVENLSKLAAFQEEQFKYSQLSDKNSLQSQQKPTIQKQLSKCVIF